VLFVALCGRWEDLQLAEAGFVAGELYESIDLVRAQNKDAVEVSTNGDTASLVSVSLRHDRHAQRVGDDYRVSHQ
jgi:hypothetical protein